MLLALLEGWAGMIAIFFVLALIPVLIGYAKVKYLEKEKRLRQEAHIELEYRRRKAFEGKAIAVTRGDYATLIDGQFQHYEPEGHLRYHRLDVAPLMRYTDLVDIKGGFDFIIGLRANGKVVVSRWADDDQYLYDMIEERGICPDEFPFGEPWDSVVSISASECRAAALTQEGKILHWEDEGWVDTKIEAPKGIYQSVVAGFDSLWMINQDGDVMALPYGDYINSIVRGYRAARQMYGVRFAKIWCHDYYYCPVTTAALTTDGEVFWNFNGLDRKEGYQPHRKLPLRDIVKVAVTRRAVAVITRDKIAHLALWEYPDRLFRVGEDVVAIELMVDGNIILIREDGSCQYRNFPGTDSEENA